MILMIDNYDSSTYNLVQYFGELGAEVPVHRKDKISVDEVAALHPTHIRLSTGPLTPTGPRICPHPTNPHKRPTSPAGAWVAGGWPP